MLAVIQARYSSVRLPGKVLMKLGSQNILERTVSQVKKSDRVSSIIIATSDNQSDEPIAELAEKSGIDFYRGDLNDVGQRLFEAAQSSSSQSFLRISADSPFIDWRIVNQAISIYEQCEVDLVSNIFPRSFPKGQSVEVINTKALKQICSSDRTSNQKEHVTPYFYENYQEFRVINFTSGQNSSDSIQCIDTPVDFEIASQVVQQIGNEDLTWQELETLFSKARNQK